MAKVKLTRRLHMDGWQTHDGRFETFSVHTGNLCSTVDYWVLKDNNKRGQKDGRSSHTTLGRVREHIEAILKQEKVD